MARNLLLLALFLCLAAPSAAYAQQSRDPAEDLSYLTEEFPPYNYLEDDRATGLSVIVLRLMWRRMGVKPQPIQFMPWPRVYQSAQIDPRIMAMSAFRTEEREELFKWVGPIAHGRLSVFALTRSNVHVDSFEDLARYRIGAVRDMAATAMVNQPGFDVTVSNRTPTAIRMLESGRIDVLALDDHTFYSNAKELEFSPGHFKNVFVLRTEAIYYFLSKDTPDEMIGRFQRALDEVKQTPEYRNLLNRYLN